MMDRSQPSSGPLAGIRVLDLTRILAGPHCTMMLGDMGAEVIKVEQPGKGDDTRSWGPPFAGGESAYFLGVNRNKRSLTLDLKAARGQEILAKLARGADVLVENFKPGTLQKMGLDDEWLRANAPRLVHCAISGYGSTGPKGGRPGYDFILQAESGLMSITGESAGDPMKLGVAIVDLCTGMYAAATILAALTARGRDGAGQRVEVCLYDTGVSLLANVAANHLVSGEAPGRYGNGHPNVVPYRTYPTRDGRLALAVGNDAQFQTFARLVGHPEWSEDPRFRRNQDRVVNRDEMDRLVSIALRRQDSARWSADFDAAGIPCTSIRSVPEALNDPHTIARDMVVTTHHGSAGELKLLGIPFRFSATPASIRCAPPMLGEHTDEILREELRLTDSDISQLRESGVI